MIYVVSVIFHSKKTPMQAAIAAPSPAAVIANDKRVQKRKLIVGLLQPVLNRKQRNAIIV